MSSAPLLRRVGVGAPRRALCRARVQQRRTLTDLSRHGNVLGGEALQAGSPRLAAFEGWHRSIEMAMAGNKAAAKETLGEHVADGVIFVCTTNLER